MRISVVFVEIVVAVKSVKKFQSNAMTFGAHAICVMVMRCTVLQLLKFEPDDQCAFKRSKEAQFIYYLPLPTQISVTASTSGIKT